MSIQPKSHELLTNVNRANRALSDLLRTCLSHHGLTIPQWTILGYLSDKKTARPVDLTKHLGVKAPFVAKTLAELEAQKCITSKPFPDDERGKVIELTSAGHELITNIEPMLQECLSHQLEDVKQPDLATYFSVNQYIGSHVHHH